MSDNTKSSKMDRVLKRQLETKPLLEIIATQAETIVRQSNTMQIQASVIRSLEAKLERWGKYMGGILFARRRLQALKLPTLDQTS